MNTNTIIKLLKKTKKYIPSHYKWTKGAYFRNSIGENIGRHSVIRGKEKPTRCCLLGAIFKAEKDMNIKTEIRYYAETAIIQTFKKQKGIEKQKGITIPDINDRSTHKDIIQLINDTIKELKCNPSQ